MEQAKALFLVMATFVKPLETGLFQSIEFDRHRPHGQRLELIVSGQSNMVWRNMAQAF